jgi:hypothetical protein
LTAISGLPAASASALPVTSPTMTPPISPGPAVAAIASTSASVTPASASAPSTRRDQRLDMRARGDFGHDAAIRAVRRFLPGKAVRQDAPVAGHQRGRGFVAGGFKAEDQAMGSRLTRSRRAATTRVGIWRCPAKTQAMAVFSVSAPGARRCALVQANMVAQRCIAAHGWAGAIEIVPIRTTGDKVQDRALAEIGGKALWTKELDRALLDGEIDCAVHSMKDVETIRPIEIVIAAMLPRADVRDRLIGADSIAALPQDARGRHLSPRRAAQVRRARPDLRSCCSAAMSIRG